MAGSLRAALFVGLSMVWVLPTASRACFPQSRGILEQSDAGPGVVNHPVGVRPSAAVKIPSGWPLAPDGTITCDTCHGDKPSGLAGANLRGKGSSDNHPQAFCMQCHAESASGTSVHWQAVRFAHVSWEDHRAGNRTLYDAASRECLSCHDGVAARDAGHTMAGSLSDFGDASRNHPVGVPYPMMGRTKADVPLRPASSVPQSVNLAGGMVSCLSCHNLYAPDPARLSVPVEGSRLCMSCHDLD